MLQVTLRCICGSLVVAGEFDAQVAGDYEGLPVLLFGRQLRSDEVPERRGILFDGGDPRLVGEGTGCCRQEKADIDRPAVAVVEPVEAVEQVVQERVRSSLGTAFSLWPGTCRLDYLFDGLIFASSSSASLVQAKGVQRSL